MAGSPGLHVAITRLPREIVASLIPDVSFDRNSHPDIQRSRSARASCSVRPAPGNDADAAASSTAPGSDDPDGVLDRLWSGACAELDRKAAAEADAYCRNETA